MLVIMSDEPDDLRDTGGRARRLAIALLVGAVVAVAAYFLANQLADPDDSLRANGAYSTLHNSNTMKFIGATTGLAGALAFSVTLAILNAQAAKRWRARRIPPAKQVS